VLFFSHFGCHCYECCGINSSSWKNYYWFSPFYEKIAPFGLSLISFVNNRHLRVKNDFKMKKRAEDKVILEITLLNGSSPFVITFWIFSKRDHYKGDNVGQNSKLWNKRRVFMVWHSITCKEIFINFDCLCGGCFNFIDILASTRGAPYT